ncbi:hypothetical protein [Streptomyces sp. CJ_13]|uniref:hypothetical protein n=1 Tax=Streptomyces sp. CJ_13 TaxID=2724943 RepID=UPI001BDD1718|nr:hypothetical protein [Streptomyces sp. CJ_13]
MPVLPVERRMPPEGYRRAIEAHRRAAPSSRVDPGIAQAVERQNALMRKLSQQAFPDLEELADEQPEPIDSAVLQRRRQLSEGEAGAGDQGLQHGAHGRVELPFVSGGAQHDGLVGALQRGPGGGEGQDQAGVGGDVPMYGREGAGRPGSRASRQAANSDTMWGWRASDTFLRSCSANVRSAGPATVGTFAGRVGEWRSRPEYVHGQRPVCCCRRARAIRRCTGTPVGVRRDAAAAAVRRRSGHRWS